MSSEIITSMLREVPTEVAHKAVLLCAGTGGGEASLRDGVSNNSFVPRVLRF